MLFHRFSLDPPRLPAPCVRRLRHTVPNACANYWINTVSATSRVFEVVGGPQTPIHIVAYVA